MAGTESTVAACGLTVVLTVILTVIPSAVLPVITAEPEAGVTVYFSLKDVVTLNAVIFPFASTVATLGALLVHVIV
jgi:hypothetical protein